MDQPLVARLLHAPEEAPDLTIRQPQQRARFPLCDPLLPYLANHMDLGLIVTVSSRTISPSF
jgi:hypothetical protein